MKTIKIIDEDFTNYQEPSMLISATTCSFKCEKESKTRCCHNSSLASLTPFEVDDDLLIKRYLNNPITQAVVFSGLEPLEQFEEICGFIKKLREKYHCNDTVVIYTGFNKSEVLSQIEILKQYENIVVKFGRYIPNKKKHYDEILGVWLASPNQRAERIS